MSNGNKMWVDAAQAENRGMGWRRVHGARVCAMYKVRAELHARGCMHLKEHGGEAGDTAGCDQGEDVA